METIYKAIWGSPETPLKIGELEIPCYVLEDERRVLSGRGMQDALRLGQGHGTKLKQFLASDKIKPFIDNELAMVLKTPIKFIRPGRGGRPALGYEATVLVDICHAVLDARKDGKLKAPIQLLVADQCEILTRAFAKVGIIALVDEATGYQEIRARQDLEKILEAFIAKELLKWTKTFPDEFYKRLFELKGWQYYPPSVKRPKIVGRLTNDLIYSRLAPSILKELQRKNPITPKGRRKNKHHQWLTEDIGHPKLREHIASTVNFMRASTSWNQFYRLMNRALPIYGETIELLLETEKGELV